MPSRNTTATAGASIQSKRESVRVKKEKVKQEKVKEKRRTETPVDEDSHWEEQETNDVEDNGTDCENHEGHVSPRGNKRRRVNGEGVSGATDGNGQPELTLLKVKTLPRGADGYIPGSIVRIQLFNFVTYDFVEFKPGPYLNMIIGPNGTGKSSIACAIALGLNFSPSILGRATELNQFVKNGTDSGYIEIELKGPKGKPNLVIRRNLKSVSRGSTFTFNGQSATGTDIKRKMAELNVQVGNLCSFLPQDRVSEFARMTPQQLLRETQRAAGDENLTKWHDTLIEAGKELGELQATIKTEEDTLKQMKDRNEGIERDVQRYKERKKIEHNIALLDLLIPVAQYREIRAKFIEAKAIQRQLHAKVSRLQTRNEPAHALLKEFEKNYKNAEKDREALKKSTQAKFQKLSSKNQASDKLDQESSEIVEKLANMKKEEKERAKQINFLENEIVKLQAEVDRPPVDLPDDEELKDQQRQLNLEKSALATRIDEFNGKMSEIANKKAAAMSEYDGAERRLRELDNVDLQKLHAMERWDKDTHDAIVWVRNNRHLFRMEVFETPFMRITIKDKKYTNAVEACFSVSQMRAFVAQCQEDVDTLNKNINDDAVLGRKVRIMTWFRPTQFESLVPPPMNPEEMQQYGFDGYALDYIDCPEGIKYFLMKDINLHRTAIALNRHTIDVNKVMEVVARPIPDFQHPGGATFVIGRTMNIVTRSRYGRKAIGNMTRDIQDARNLTAPSIDPEVRRRIDNAIAEARQTMDLCDEEKVNVKDQYSDIEKEKKKFEEREAEIKKKRQAITDEKKRKINAETKLGSKTKTLRQLKAMPSADARRAELKAKLVGNNQKRMEFAQQYTDLIHSIIHEQQECTRVGLRYLQISANKMCLQELCEKKDGKYQSALKEYTKANEHFQQIKAQSKEILEESRTVLNAASEEVREEYHQIEEVRLQYEREEKEAREKGLPPPDGSAIDFRTVEELKAELETQKAKLDLNMITNPGVIEQYEQRKMDIENLEKTLAGRKMKEEKVQKGIKNARDNWQPSLQKLVSSIGTKFSAAFDHIGCAGEIRINEHEDYEKWAIDILVKFRDSEKLQLLTAHRQSGGERSLTTILYLMSLTEEARAPFSLVDEINQGMDRRAERVVHNSMVNVTCKPDSAQYFLITPKLLPDLEYHERMKILCVNNGEWLPEERNVSGKMLDMIEAFVSLKASDQ